MTGKALLLLLLMICSISDIQSRTISVKILLCFGIAALSNMILNILTGTGGVTHVTSVCMGLLPGAAFLGLAKITREGIGYGDGYLLMVTGMLVGLQKTTELILAALFLTAILSAFFLCLQHANRKKELPFVPALLAAFVLQEIWK